MQDNIIIVTSINALAYFGVDYLGLHGFGIEVCISFLSAIIIIFLNHRENKKLKDYEDLVKDAANHYCCICSPNCSLNVRAQKVLEKYNREYKLNG
jgi:hypothetical protein